MKQERTSYAFLMEMIWVCAFFLICASIFVTTFAKAEQVSRQADVLNQAVQASSNVMEEAFASFSADSDHLELLADSYATDDFSINLEYSTEDGLTTVTVTAVNPENGTVIYSLQGAKALPEGGAS